LEADGLWLGEADGDFDGLAEGDAEGDSEGDELGLAEGLLLVRMPPMTRSRLHISSSNSIILA